MACFIFTIGLTYIFFETIFRWLICKIIYTSSSSCLLTALSSPKRKRKHNHSENWLCDTGLGYSKFCRIFKLHHRFKRNGTIAGWLESAYWWNFISSVQFIKYTMLHSLKTVQILQLFFITKIVQNAYQFL